MYLHSLVAFSWPHWWMAPGRRSGSAPTGRSWSAPEHHPWTSSCSAWWSVSRGSCTRPWAHWHSPPPPHLIGLLLLQERLFLHVLVVLELLVVEDLVCLQPLHHVLFLLVSEMGVNLGLLLDLLTVEKVLPREMPLREWGRGIGMSRGLMCLQLWSLWILFSLRNVV